MTRPAAKQPLVEGAGEGLLLCFDLSNFFYIAEIIALIIVMERQDRQYFIKEINTVEISPWAKNACRILFPHGVSTDRRLYPRFMGLNVLEIPHLCEELKSCSTSEISTGVHRQQSIRCIKQAFY